MRGEISEAIDEALGTSTEHRSSGRLGRARVDVGHKGRQLFLLRLRRFVDNLPDDVTVADLRDELSAQGGVS